MTNYRSLSVEEIDTLERQGCEAANWTRVSVGEGFEPSHIKDILFLQTVWRKRNKKGAFPRDILAVTRENA